MKLIPPSLRLVLSENGSAAVIPESIRATASELNRWLHAVTAAMILAGLRVPVSAFAQTRPDTTGTRPDDTTAVERPAIEVTASILSSAGPKIGSGIPARTTIVAGAAVDAWAPRLLSQALVGQPGISLYDDLGSRFKTTLVTRGFTASPVVGLPQGVSVFVDGVPVDEPDAGQVNFDLMPLEHVARVELLSGTASLLGPHSLGGAINLVTRRGRGVPSGEMEVSAGSYGAYSAEASAEGASRGWNYYAGGGYDRGHAPVGTGRGSFRAYFRGHDAERFNVSQPADPDVRSFSRNRSLGANADWHGLHDLASGTLALRVGGGGSVHRTEIHIFAEWIDPGLTTHVQSPMHDVSTYSVVDYARGPFTFSGGTRLDAIRIPFRNRLNPERDTTSTFVRLSPRAGLRVQVGWGTSLYTSVGQSFRAPAVIELACADPENPCPLPFALGDDPPLDRVVATSYELGAQWLRGPLP